MQKVVSLVIALSYTHISCYQLTHLCSCCHCAVVIEQENPLAPPSEARYNYEIGCKEPNEFFLSYPRAAYTGARTIQRHSIVQLGQHIFRTSNSLRLMTFSEKEDQLEPDYVTKDLSIFRDEKQFEVRLLPLLKAGLQKYYAEVEEDHDKTHETKVSFLCGYSFEPHQVHFAAQFAPLRSPPRKRVAVDVEGSPREHAAAKDSKWVRDRLTLEKHKLPNANEVLLTDHSGNIYEGMASNFFAIVNENGSPTLVTAGLEHVLLGTIMKIVLRVCEKRKIPVKWEFPSLQDAVDGKWEGCFLSSTSRLVLPIETIQLKDGRYVLCEAIY
ncbi:hypothetical protein INT43_007263 [Umbelopsis isabellina]|uniref:Uncharacterized protein n=1 Tax=Mortierella isabellina TaxID=91625 RepID=A0A8H7UJR0_MORIS|nr:hypothetical protein INT43_007263 [Umbelopsis isabellina]